MYSKLPTLPLKVWQVLGIAFLQAVLFRVLQGSENTLSATWQTFCYVLVILIPTGTVLGLHAREGKMQGFKTALLLAVATGALMAVSVQIGANRYSSVFQMNLVLLGLAYAVTFSALIGRQQGQPLFNMGVGLLITLGAAQLFAGLVLMLVYLIVALFQAIGFKFLQMWLMQSGIPTVMLWAFTVGVGALRQRTELTEGASRTILFIVSWILPVLALVSVVFLGSALFAKREALYEGLLSSGLYLGFSVVLLLLINIWVSVQQFPEKHWLSRVVRWLPLMVGGFAALAVYGLNVRIQEYGWTEPRIWAAILTFFMLLTSAVYLVVLRPEKPLGNLQQGNLWVAGALVALVLLVQVPVLRPIHFAVASQKAMVKNGTGKNQVLDAISYLSSEGNEEGRKALKALKKLDLPAEHKVWIQAALDGKSLYAFRNQSATRQITFEAVKGQALDRGNLKALEKFLLSRTGETSILNQLNCQNDNCTIKYRVQPLPEGQLRALVFYGWSDQPYGFWFTLKEKKVVQTGKLASSLEARDLKLPVPAGLQEDDLKETSTPVDLIYIDKTPVFVLPEQRP